MTTFHLLLAAWITAALSLLSATLGGRNTKTTWEHPGVEGAYMLLGLVSTAAILLATIAAH